MSGPRRSDVLGKLPHSRPHRRSQKRGARPPDAAAAPAAGEVPAEPAPSGAHDLVGTAVQAAVELAEIGFGVGVRALREAVSRLPRP
jgi:hypothetical protein